MDTARFIERAREVHGDDYDYSNVEYTHYLSKVEIICPVDGSFWQTPHHHVNRRQGCRLCGIKKNATSNRKTIEKFIEDARKIHGDDYDYSNVEYINDSTKIKIICNCCYRLFEQTPNSHLHGSGCNDCAIKQRTDSRRKTIEKFIEDARKIHGDDYDYSKVKYKNTHTKVEIICKKCCRSFWQTPLNHITGGCGCPKCKFPGFSHIANSWLAWREVNDGVKIQTIMSEDGEFRICGKPVDGYSKENNTVYEFHGDMWHGNPLHPVFGNPEGINPISKKTYGELYEKTIAKKNQIIEAGYNYVEIWETEWRRALCAVRTIQKLWRRRLEEKVT